jgi:hypothetical protein
MPQHDNVVMVMIMHYHGDVLMKIIITRLMVFFHEELLNFLLERNKKTSPLISHRINIVIEILDKALSRSLKALSSREA